MVTSRILANVHYLSYWEQLFGDIKYENGILCRWQFTREAVSFSSIQFFPVRSGFFPALDGIYFILNIFIFGIYNIYWMYISCFACILFASGRVRAK